jgi:hypothetical protein
MNTLLVFIVVVVVAGLGAIVIVIGHYERKWRKREQGKNL